MGPNPIYLALRENERFATSFLERNIVCEGIKIVEFETNSLTFPYIDMFIQLFEDGDLVYLSQEIYKLDISMQAKYSYILKHQLLPIISVKKYMTI